MPIFPTTSTIVLRNKKQNGSKLWSYGLHRLINWRDRSHNIVMSVTMKFNYLVADMFVTRKELGHLEIS